jgi:tetratricopeptide (TPR) repeat protein
MEKALREYLKRARWSGIEIELTRAEAASAVSRRLSTAEVQKRWGDLFLATERLREARVCLEEAVRLDADLGPAWEGLGFLELAEGAPERAKAHFQKAIDLEAASGPGLTRYAEILLADYRGRVDSIPDPIAEQAASVLRKSLVLQPGARAPSELLAFLHLVRGERLDEAEALVETALAMAPDDPPLLFLRGQLLAKRGEYEEARRDLKRAMERSGDPRLHQEAEDFLARMAEMERAPGR